MFLVVIKSELILLACTQTCTVLFEAVLMPASPSILVAPSSFDALIPLFSMAEPLGELERRRSCCCCCCCYLCALRAVVAVVAGRFSGERSCSRSSCAATGAAGAGRGHSETPSSSALSLYMIACMKTSHSLSRLPAGELCSCPALTVEAIRQPCHVLACLLAA